MVDKMVESLKWLLRHILPAKSCIKIMYWTRLGKKLDLDNPKTFTEKLQWLKLYGCNPQYTRLVDKYEVKQYIAEKLGKEYLVPTIGVWDRFSDIDFGSFPKRFVLKTTHDSGGVVICKDKGKFHQEEARAVLEKSLKRNYYYCNRELPYKNVKPRIIAEEYIENDKKEGLHDYKVWCFHGEPTYIQYITGRDGGDTYEAFYDKSWKKQAFVYHNPLYVKDVEPPVCLKELLTLARILATGIPFVRADFYILEDSSIRFGEMTFYPMSGFEKWDPPETDLRMGEMLQLPEKKKI